MDRAYAALALLLIGACFAAETPSHVEGAPAEPPPVRVDGQRSTLVAGREFTCEEDSRGQMSCWGDGWRRTLLLGERVEGQDVAALAVGVTDGMADGWQPACIVTRGGAVECNNHVPPVRDVVDVAIGVEYACALLPGNRGVACWRIPTDPRLPMDTLVEGLSRIPIADATELAVGRYHACAISGEGQLSCWGFDDGCPLQQISGMGVVTGIASRTDTCVVNDAGAVRCWPGTACPGREVPAAPEIREASLVAAGHEVNCAVVDRNVVTCWPASTSASHPLLSGRTAFEPGSTIEALAVGQEHVCARRGTGEVACWGANRRRQLDGPAPQEMLRGPQKILGLRDSVSVVVGQEQSCAQVSGGAVYCWGRTSRYGDWSGHPRRVVELDGAKLVQDSFDLNIAAVVGTDWLKLENGEISERREIHGDLGFDAAVQDIPRIEYTRDRNNHERVCAIRLDGAPVCTTHASGGRSGPPRTVAGVRDLVLCLDGLCTIDDAGQVLCGRLDPSIRRPKRTIELPSPAVQIACTAMDACARLADGSIHCWGDPRGESPRPLYPGMPIKIPLRGAAEGLSMSLRAACAWSRGGVECWGDEPGLPTEEVLATPPLAAPRLVAGLDAIVQVATGSNHACALHSTGEVSCWGSNHHGAAGVGSGEATRTPVAVALP